MKDFGPASSNATQQDGVDLVQLNADDCAACDPPVSRIVTCNWGPFLNLFHLSPIRVFKDSVLTETQTWLYSNEEDRTKMRRR